MPSAKRSDNSRQSRRRTLTTRPKRATPRSRTPTSAMRFETLVGTLSESDLSKELRAVAPSQPKTGLVLGAEALETSEEEPSLYNVLTQAATVSVKSDAMQTFIGNFVDSPGQAKTAITTLFDYYNRARDQLRNLSDHVEHYILEPSAVTGHTWDEQLLRYLVMGQYQTRLGVTLLLPGDQSRDKTLETVLGILRILFESHFDIQYPNLLPWLADDNSAEAQRFKTWETKAGDLGDRIGSSLGRTAAVTATSLISPFVKLPDEITQAISFLAGVNARKVTELKMHQYLMAHPDLGV